MNEERDDIINALERIKGSQQRFDEPNVVHAIAHGHPDVIFSIVCEENKFLLKAFKVMREIAVEHYDTLENHTEYQDSPRLVDEEFENRMKE